MKIVLDTSFLITAVKFKVDFFPKLTGNQLFVLDRVIEELKKISEGRGKDASFARTALNLLKNRTEVLEAEENADEALILYGKRGYGVATQDIELKKRLRAENVKLIYLRQKKYVKIEE